VLERIKEPAGRSSIMRLSTRAKTMTPTSLMVRLAAGFPNDALLKWLPISPAASGLQG
jgi:hypothetical protein